MVGQEIVFEAIIGETIGILVLNKGTCGFSLIL